VPDELPAGPPLPEELVVDPLPPTGAAPAPPGEGDVLAHPPTRSQTNIVANRT
jgi:hypothetical protein